MTSLSNLGARVSHAPKTHINLCAPVEGTSNLFRGGYEARASDIFIAVMGMTGSGKSSFISMCTDEKVEVGHGLEGCTQRVRPYKCKWSHSANVYLVDTPGFDDTARSDTEVLKEIAAWLNDSYKENVLLRGVLYLQSITDPRMQGTAKRNLWMFKKLCGPSALQNVLLVTTMWDKAQPEVGKAHEHELVSTREFWGWMIGKGSQAHRHDNTRGSAMSLLNVLVARGPKRERALDLQVDMVDHRLSLSDTKAGQEVEGTIRRRTEKFQCEIEELRKQMREALSRRDKEAIDMLTEQQEQMQVTIWRMEHDREQLRVNAEKLHAEKQAEFELALQQQQAEQARLRGERDKRQQQDTAHLRWERDHQQQEAMRLRGERDAAHQEAARQYIASLQRQASLLRWVMVPGTPCCPGLCPGVPHWHWLDMTTGGMLWTATPHL